MNNIQVLWQEIIQTEPSAYMVAAHETQVIVNGEVIAQSPSMNTAIEQAWLKVCAPRQVEVPR